jgi:hypothetical protein
MYPCTFTSAFGTLRHASLPMIPTTFEPVALAAVATTSAPLSSL